MLVNISLRYCQTVSVESEMNDCLVRRNCKTKQMVQFSTIFKFQLYNDNNTENYGYINIPKVVSMATMRKYMRSDDMLCLCGDATIMYTIRRILYLYKKNIPMFR